MIVNNNNQPTTNNNPNGLTRFLKALDSQANESNDWHSWDAKWLANSKPVQTNFHGYVEVSKDYMSGNKNYLMDGHPDFASYTGNIGSLWVSRGKLSGTFEKSNSREIMEKFANITEGTSYGAERINNNLEETPAIRKQNYHKVVDTIYLKWNSPNGPAFRAIKRNYKKDSIGSMLYTGDPKKNNKMKMKKHFYPLCLVALFGCNL